MLAIWKTNSNTNISKMTKTLGHCTEKDFRTKEYESEFEFFNGKHIHT